MSVAAAARWRGVPRVLVGDEETLLRAADLVGVPRSKLRRLGDAKPRGGGIYILPSGPKLLQADRTPGAVTAQAGLAQLKYIEDAFAMSRRLNAPLVTAPASKAAIVASGLRRARKFRGHTEWLQELDGSKAVTMCFIGKRLASSLVTTHLPLKEVPKAITVAAVSQATRHLAELLRRLGSDKPHLAVASLNPHAGESLLLGDEEKKAIVPGIADAKKRLYGKARLSGPIGAETAFRLAAAKHFDGVVAMYHDQATIPMKLLDFGVASAEVAGDTDDVSDTLDVRTVVDTARLRTGAGSFQTILNAVTR